MVSSFPQVDVVLYFFKVPSLRDRYQTISRNFKAYEGKPLFLPADSAFVAEATSAKEAAAGPKPEYLEWHREHVFGH